MSTLTPSVSPGDSGELIVAANFLDIAHPPGYPLYSMIFKLSNLLPFGNLAYRANIWNALITALSMLVLVILLRDFQMREILIWPGVFFVYFSRPIWSMALQVEVYALNLLIFIILLYITNKVLLNKYTKRRKFLRLLIFLLFLGFSNHPTIILFSVVFGCFILITIFRDAENWKVVLKELSFLLILAIIGTSVYTYLPVRTTAKLPLNWGNPCSFSALWEHVNRGQYGTLSKNPLSLKLFCSQIKSYFINVTYYYSLFYWVGFIIGLYALFRQSRTVIYIWFCLLIIGSVGFMLLLHYPISERGLFEAEKFFPPSFVILSLFSILCINYIYTSHIHPLYLRGRRYANHIRFCLFIFLFMISFIQLNRNYYYVNRKLSWLSHDFGYNLLLPCPENSYLITEGDNATFLIAYWHLAAKFRDDLEVLDVNGYLFQGSYDFAHLPPVKRIQIEQQLLENETVCYTYPRQFAFAPSFKGKMSGVLTKAVSYHDKRLFRSSYSLTRIPRHIFNKKVHHDYLDREIIRNFCDQWGRYLLQIGRSREGVPYFGESFRLANGAPRLDKEAINKLGTAIVWYRTGKWRQALKILSESDDRLSSQGLIDYLLGNYLVELKAFEKAEIAYQKALQHNPNLVSAWINLGNIYYSKKNIAKAIKCYNDALDRDFHDQEARFNLAIIYTQLNQTEKAIDQYQTMLKIDFNNARVHQNLGWLYQTQGKLNDALNQFILAFNINPDLPGLRDNIKRLYDNIRNKQNERR